jgi:Fe-S cluster biogenesis protein NfuA/nitrite reductase/ring-hydroxylating ferredoxin subunit
VASLLLVHGLHPHDVERRIEDALDGVRPYLGSHGGDVTLLGVVDDVVRLQFAGSCKSCPSSAVTLELTVEDAVRAAAPEIASIEVVAAEAAPATATVIPAESLLSRVHQNGHGPVVWHQVPDLAELAAGEVGGFGVAGTTVLACRVGDALFAYHDRCGSCEGSLAGAVLHRPMGAPIGEAVLRCPRCHAHFDVVHAGAGIDDEASTATHLRPIPLLVRDGVLSIALTAERTKAGVA